METGREWRELTSFLALLSSLFVLPHQPAAFAAGVGRPRWQISKSGIKSVLSVESVDEPLLVRSRPDAIVLGKVPPAVFP
jgi:hypothetical protein